MATATTYNRFCKGVINNNSGIRMTWWKTSFNMPVPDIFSNGAWWVEWSWIFTYLWTDISFDLSGFEAWWEILAWFSWFNLHWPFSWGNITLTQTWKNTSGGVMFQNTWTYNFPTLSDSTAWHEVILGSNQWVASWEVNSAGTYKLEVSMVWSWINRTDIYNLYITNVPSVATYTPWMVWVEWDLLWYTSASGHRHKISGNVNGSVSSSNAGKLWCSDASDDIFWIGSWWIKNYSNSGATNYLRRTVRQIASTWSNWAPWQVFAWTSKAWMMWMDNEFWQEHIAFIGKSWYKELLFSGNYPYTDPA